MFRAFREWVRRVEAVKAALSPIDFSAQELLEIHYAPLDDPRRARLEELVAVEERLKAALDAFDQPPVPFIWPRRIVASAAPITAQSPPHANVSPDVLRVDVMSRSGSPVWFGAYRTATGRALGRSATPQDNATFDRPPNPERARRLSSATGQ